MDYILYRTKLKFKILHKLSKSCLYIIYVLTLDDVILSLIYQNDIIFHKFLKLKI